jgi:nicotinamide-nucleotide amidase
LNVELVTIGTELLLGFVTDTNGGELGRALAAAGVEVVRRTTVADRPEPVRAAVAEALERTGFVITTGGLGPTRDDVTKSVVAGLFGRRLVLDPDVLQLLEERFRRLGRSPMPATNRSQAEVPEGATVLPNPRGTAPGLWLEDDRRGVVMLPGVPSEMRGLLVEQVLPRLALRGRGLDSSLVIRSRTFRTTGIAESALAERLDSLEDKLVPLTLAYLPSPDGVDLRVTAWHLDPREADALLERATLLLMPALGPQYYGADESDLAAVVIDLLRATKHRLAVAESCTGGLLGARITAVPGSSAVFFGGIIAYHDDVKLERLGVSREMLTAHGAVSEETVRAMAAGALATFGTECAMAITGVAGPSGGSAEKPVGTVWLAAQLGNEVRALRRIFPGDRAEIRYRATQAALDLLRRLMSHPMPSTAGP